MSRQPERREYSNREEKVQRANGAINLLFILINEGVLTGPQVTKAMKIILKNYPNLSNTQLLNLETWSHYRHEEGMRDVEEELRERLEKAF